MSEPGAVLAPLVAALVRQARQELADQGVLAGVDVDPVAAGAHRRTGGRCEAGDDRVDVADLHRLGDLTTVDLGDTRRRPQLPLVPVRGALSACVAERREHQGSLGVTGRRDLTPARLGVGPQRRALIGPVGLMDRSLLDRDDPGAARRAAPVVRHVALRDRAAAAQVRLVGTEHHPGRGLERADAQRFDQRRM